MNHKQTHCPNFNHSRSNAPVRCCPSCGLVVNEKVLTRTCEMTSHLKQRREQSKYCVDCGRCLAEIED